MKTLRVTIEWLEGRYHGEEWPPSPSRRFQAMVAGLGPWRGLDPAIDAALRHLETLGPPAITAPRVERLRPVTSRVPAAAGHLASSLVAGVVGIVSFVVSAAVRNSVVRPIWRGVARQV